MPNVIDVKGAVLREEAVPAVFAGDHTAKANAIFRAVFRELANPRSGTHKTKKRDEVRGGGRKPWRQKGTGRARQGSTRSPQWRHGGVVFGPQPRSYVVSLNKKERRAAMIAALSDRFQNGGVTILDPSGFALTKTKELAALLFGTVKEAKTGPLTLVVYAPTELVEVGEPLVRCAGNLKKVAVVPTTALDVRDVVGAKRLVLTTAAHETLVGALSPEQA